MVVRIKWINTDNELLCSEHWHVVRSQKNVSCYDKERQETWAALKNECSSSTCRFLSFIYTVTAAYKQPPGWEHCPEDLVYSWGRPVEGRVREGGPGGLVGCVSPRSLQAVGGRGDHGERGMKRKWGSWKRTRVEGAGWLSPLGTSLSIDPNWLSFLLLFPFRWFGRVRKVWAQAGWDREIAPGWAGLSN